MKSIFKKEKATPPVLENNLNEIRLKLPKIATQNDKWSCGIRSSTRVLKFRGVEVSYDEVQELRKKRFGIPLIKKNLPFYKAGTRPKGVCRVLKHYLDECEVKTKANIDWLTTLLSQYTPVITLLQVGDNKGVFGNLPLLSRVKPIPALHWVVVSGFDRKKERIYYYDTYANDERSYSYKEFKKKWLWSNKMSSVLGFKKGTIVYSPRSEAEEKEDRYQELY
ncbi:hypothetical protein HOF92_12330 [bacterium]|nr:hypothetical protein [bacterium]